MSESRSEPSKNLEEFLEKFKVAPGSAPTHTRFGEGFGSYYIPNAYTGELHRLFAQAVHRRLTSRSNRVACLVERHVDNGPVVIDLDFRFKPALDDPPPVVTRGGAAGGDGDNGPPPRRHDAAWIRRFLRAYCREMRKWVRFPESEHDGVDAYVLEKPAPRAEKDCVKDGVHIVIPGIVTHPRVQLLVRQALLAGIKPMFEDLGTLNSHENAFDEAVIQRNGWMLYGSSKQGSPAYDVTAVYRLSAPPNEDDVVISQGAAWQPPRTLEAVRAAVELLSIRNKGDRATPLRPEKQLEVQRHADLEESIRRRIKDAPHYLQPGVNEQRVVGEHYDLAQRLVAILDDERAEEYDSWLRVGWCLHNIDHRLLHEWIDFSKRSPKFKHGVCETYWSHMVYRSDGHGIGSLRMWARQDSPEQYEGLLRQSLAGKIRVATSSAHHDIATVVAAMFQTRFVCTSIKNNQWYEFKKHRWIPCDSGFSLRKTLSIEVYNRFSEEASRCSLQARRISGNEAMSEEYMRLCNLHDKLVDVGKKLKVTSFKDAVMKECRELMYVPNFEGDLDGKPNLLGFENGVYDLDTHQFRDGCPEDMVSFSTRNSFMHFDDSEAVYQEIAAFFEQIQTDRGVREYLLRFLASCLHGNTREERFHVFTGTGSNGKSICVDLFEKALGDYACKVPVTLLTQKRAASNAATSEVARCKGRRFVCLQEPGNDEVLNIGLMKELTGGDRIMARSLYKEPIEFKPMMKLAMTANNLPEVRSDDGGTWRRIRVVEYRSKFLESPDPEQPNEFLLDNTLTGKLDAWAPHFMCLLIEYFKVYRREGNPEPEQVLTVTRQYRQNNDVIQMFIDYNLEPDPRATITAETLHNKYKDFVKAHALFGYGSLKRNELVQAVQKHTKTRVVGTGALCKISGLRLLPPPEPDEEDQDDDQDNNGASA